MNLAQKFARTPFARFINSTPGRIARIVVGAVLVIWGCVHLDESGAVMFIIAGLVPLAAGTVDICLISPLVGGPISGEKVRAMDTRD
jgi:DUF2892 family protein